MGATGGNHRIVGSRDYQRRNVDTGEHGTLVRTKQNRLDLARIGLGADADAHFYDFIPDVGRCVQDGPAVPGSPPLRREGPCPFERRQWRDGAVRPARACPETHCCRRSPSLSRWGCARMISSAINAHIERPASTNIAGAVARMRLAISNKELSCRVSPTLQCARSPSSSIVATRPPHRYQDQGSTLSRSLTIPPATAHTPSTMIEGQ
jgi:hypothetical protein